MPTCCSDTSPLPQSSGSPTRAPSCESGQQTDGSQGSRCGKATSESSTPRPTPAEWIRSQADSLARTFPALEAARASMESAADCGESSRESLARYNRATSSWKTPQCSLLGGLDEFSETWPRWGMMRDGVSYRLPTLAPLTDESGCGFWPTPTKMDSFSDRSNAKWSGTAAYVGGVKRNTDLAAYLKHLGRKDLATCPVFREALMGWPAGSTETRLSGTAKFPSRRQPRGGSWVVPSAQAVSSEVGDE